MSPGAEQVRAQLDRILASSNFTEAERARKFLRFVVESALAGRTQETKESVIAVEVFGRPPSFDPRIDPIVRVEAGRLRSRLMSYYQSGGGNDPILIDLPKGGYVPQFVERTPNGRPAASPSPRSRIALLAAGAALLGFVVSWAIWSPTPRPAAPAANALRLSVLPPGGSEFQNSAISPDGQYLAFTATTGNVTRLWIRALNSTEPRVLPGTEEAAYPFWSPDSKFIGFFSVGKLKKIQLSGGPAQVLCNTRPAFGGTWGAGGVLLFAQRGNGGIYRVPESGGQPQQVTALDAAHGELAHVFPYFLPDGRRFLYSAIARGPGEVGLYAASLDSPERRFLFNADPGVAFTPAHAGGVGTVIFAYHGALMSQPFDATRPKTAGTPTQLAAQVRHQGERADFSVSTSGVLAFQDGNDDDRQLTWFDRNGTELRVVGPRNHYSSIVLSPDQKRLAIHADDSATGRPGIWLLDLDRGSLMRASPQDASGMLPTWSPDGKAIAFSMEAESGMSLVREPVDSTTPSPLLQGKGVKIANDWSADGKLIAYTASWPKSDWLGVWVAPAGGDVVDGGHSFSSTGHNECCAAFSPQVAGGVPRWIAYSSDETGKSEVYVRDFPAGGHRWQVSTGAGWSPHWSRDGRELFYLALDGKLMVVDLAAGPGGARAPRPLFATRIPFFSYPALPGNSYAVSPDGRRFLVNFRPEKAVPDSITILFHR